MRGLFWLMNSVIYVSSRSHCSKSPFSDGDEICPATLLILENVTSSLVRYIQALKRQINIGLGSAACINLGSSPAFVTCLSFNLMLPIHDIDFEFVYIWAKISRRAVLFACCRLLFSCVLASCAQRGEKSIEIIQANICELFFFHNFY